MFEFYAYAFLMWFFFSMNGGHSMFGGMDKIFRVCRYPFYKLKSYKWTNCPRSIYYTLLGSDLIMQDTGKFDVKMNVISNGLEKYIAFTINKNLVFIDNM